MSQEESNEISDNNLRGYVVNPIPALGAKSGLEIYKNRYFYQHEFLLLTNKSIIQ